jgi:cysteinyl-tRNA synthetase
MSYTYDQLSKMAVAELRKIADGIEHEAVHGHSTMHKEKLLPAICKALNIDIHVHHTAVGINKTAMKAEIRSWKKKRAEALTSKDYVKLSEIRQHIHDLKVKLRRAIV